MIFVARFLEAKGCEEALQEKKQYGRCFRVRRLARQKRLSHEQLEMLQPYWSHIGTERRRESARHKGVNRGTNSKGFLLFFCLQTTRTPCEPISHEPRLESNGQ